MSAEACTSYTRDIIFTEQIHSEESRTDTLTGESNSQHRIYLTHKAEYKIWCPENLRSPSIDIAKLGLTSLQLIILLYISVSRPEHKIGESTIKIYM